MKIQKMIEQIDRPQLRSLAKRRTRPNESSFQGTREARQWRSVPRGSICWRCRSEGDPQRTCTQRGWEKPKGFPLLGNVIGPQQYSPLLTANGYLHYTSQSQGKLQEVRKADYPTDRWLETAQWTSETKRAYSNLWCADREPVSYTQSEITCWDSICKVSGITRRKRGLHTCFKGDKIKR